MVFPGGTSGKEPAGQYRKHEAWFWSQSQEDPLEEGMAAHSSILAWRIPMDRGASQAQLIGWQRVTHDWGDWAHKPSNTAYVHAQNYWHLQQRTWNNSKVYQ